MGRRQLVFMATDGMPIEAREIARQIIETNWPTCESFSAGHACFLRAELRKHFPKTRKAA